MAVSQVAREHPDAGAAATQTRRDAWWLSPAAFVVLFTAFAVWATFRAFQNADYVYQNYLSPFYSPTVPLRLRVGPYTISPALYILVFPLAFRLSCYYYRKAIYRGYMADPPGCAIREPAPLERSRFKRYMGEKAFPFVLMNFHRYAFYAAVVILGFLWYDVYEAFFCFPGPGGAQHFGIGVGSLVFLINVIPLTLYTFSCHSWRHLIGGGTDCYSCSLMSRTRYGMWKQVSFLNERHGTWAMISLVTVGLVDVYVYLVASGAIHDFRLVG